jgi:hypothetical protein
MRSSSPFKEDTEFKLKTREDFLNFSIEEVWKQMEEIERSKKAAHELFTGF